MAEHVWSRNGSWGYECLRCKRQSGVKDPSDLPKDACR